jgi:hypothetical protein
MPGMSPEESKVFAWAAGTVFFTSFLTIILSESANQYWKLGLHPSVALQFGGWIVGWSIPTAMYLLYHRVTRPLPMWMTPGRPVSFGGVSSNICDEFNANRWPCFPSQMKNWLANVSESGGWKYLFQPPIGFVGCLVFLAFNLGMLIAMVHFLRKPRFEELLRAQETCSLCGQRRTDVTSSELGDAEKQ